MAELKTRVRAVAMARLEKLLADKSNAERVAKAIGLFQSGRRRFEGAQDRVLKTFGVATRGDLESVRRAVSSLGRRVDRFGRD